jgi:WD40 repeat protein
VFSPDGTRIAVSGSEYIPIYDARTGRTLLKLPSRTCKAEFSPDGTKVAISGGLECNAALVWDARTGRLLETLQGHTGAEDGLDWRPDGTRIATSGNDGTARVWDPGRGSSCLC